MLRKIILSSLLSFSFITSFAQERIGSFENDLKKPTSFIKEVIPIVNSKNKDVAVFFADAKNVYGYKLNDKFDVTSKITSEEKRRKYRTLLGYTIPSDDNYKIILTNNNEKKFLLVDFSFSEKKSTTKEFVLDNYDEKIVQTISYKNKFYLITAKPFDKYYDRKTGKKLTVSFHDDIINIYSLDENNKLIKKEINLSTYKYIGKKGERVKTRSLLTSIYESGVVPKIDPNISNPIDITAKTSKLYIKNNTAVFTFDQNNDLTQLLEINLDNFETKFDSYQKNLLKAKRSNSYFLKDKMFIISSNKKELLLEVFKVNSKESFKTFTASADKDIAFKNSPIIQKGGVYANYRELKTTKQFLRKITTDKFGLTVFKDSQNYKISIGGYSPVQKGGMMIGGFGGIPIAGVGGITMFFNPTMFAYSATTGTKSTQIDCLFDLNFEHVKGEIPKNSFDKIDTFLDRRNNWLTDTNDDDLFRESNSDDDGENEEEIAIAFKDDRHTIIEVFKYKNETILGSYDRASEKYYFYKF